MMVPYYADLCRFCLWLQVFIRWDLRNEQTNSFKSMTFRAIWLAVVCGVLSNVLCYIGHPGRRGLRQERIKERFQGKRQKLEYLSLSQDPKDSLEKLRCMSKGKMDGSPLKLLERHGLQQNDGSGLFMYFGVVLC